jgi:undecaprenyl-diphosphatase
MWPHLQPTMAVIAHLGQQAICVPVLVWVSLLVARRSQTWLPVVTAVTAVLLLNFVVGVLKLLAARDSPLRDNPDFFRQGLVYPSGHGTNTILVYGLAAYLVSSHLGKQTRLARVLVTATPILAVIILVSGIYLDYHWFSDVVGGFLLGGFGLSATVDLHRAWRARPKKPPRAVRPRSRNQTMTRRAAG